MSICGVHLSTSSTLKFTVVVLKTCEFEGSAIVYITVYEPMLLLYAVMVVLASPVTLDVPLVVNVSAV